MIRTFFNVSVSDGSSISGVELAQIPRYALLQLLAPPLDFRAREILVAVVYGFELAAINRNALYFGTVATFASSASYLTWVLWISGYPERAARLKAEVFSFAAKLNRILTTGWVLCYAGVILEQFFSNVAAVSAHAKTHATLMAEHGMNTYQGVMGFYEGWAIASSGEVEKGIALAASLSSLRGQERRRSSSAFLRPTGPGSGAGRGLPVSVGTLQ